MRLVVYKNGKLVAEVEVGTDISMYRTDEYEYFIVDEKIVPITETVIITEPVSGRERIEVNPLSDARLRAPLAYAKQLQIQVVKEWCGHYIEKKYPVYKQLNIMAENDDDLITMRTFINAVRTQSNYVEELINQQDSNEAVMLIDYKEKIMSMAPLEA